MLQVDDSKELSKDLRNREATNTLAAGDYQWQFPTAGTPNVGWLGRTRTNSASTPATSENLPQVAAKDGEAFGKGAPPSGPSNIYELNVAGYLKLPAEVGKYGLVSSNPGSFTTPEKQHG